MKTREHERELLLPVVISFNEVPLLPLVPVPVLDPAISLANEAAELLGYGYTQEVLMVETERANWANEYRAQQIELVSALAELEINIYSPESVKAYQDAVVEKANRESAREARQIYKKLTVVAGISLVALVSIIWVSHAITKATEIGDNPITLICLGLAVIDLMFLPWFMFESFSATSDSFFWHQTKINEYQEAIPDYAIKLAILVKKRVPNALFYIENLGIAKLDPFLVVKTNSFTNTQYYIARWDEPTFVGKLIT